MDIYSVLSSKAISEHCRKIGYRFTPLEMAFIVHINDVMSISQKHSAFNEIILEQPDMEVPERTWTPHFDSLREFLKRYMDTQNKYLSLFYENDSNCVYTYEIWFSMDEDYIVDERLFRSFDSCYKAILADIDDILTDCDAGNSILDIRVTKRWINTETDEHPKYLSVCIDKYNNPMDLWQDCCVIDEDDQDILRAFTGLWIEIPTPFKKGDLLVECLKRKCDQEPFVLDEIPYWDKKTAELLRANGDSSDYNAFVYRISKDGTLYPDHDPNYLRLEYCNKKLTDNEKVLTALSNYIKGELPLEMLLNSYTILRAENQANNERLGLKWFSKNTLKKAGLK